MTHTPRRFACLVILCTAVAACGDRAPLASVVDRNPGVATPLQFTLPTDDVLAAGRLDGGSRVTPLDASPVPNGTSRLGDAATGSPTAYASTTAEQSIIRNPRTRAFFMKANGATVAVGEGYMEFFATRAEQSTNVSVSTTSGGLLSATQQDSFGQPFPLWDTMVTYARIPLSRDCGYNVIASTNHKAWQAFLLPSFSEFGHTYATTYSGLDQLPACPTTIQTTTGTGGEGDSRIVDSQWQVCYWLVWYDTNGVELWRDFLYCTAI